ncbi:hypothetical protein DK095_70022 [Flavobacterium psychrophilum]|nr:hypothetical protein DK095_70022 [Flavobacterium psychrophilum]
MTNCMFFIPVNLNFKWYNIRSKKSSLPKKTNTKVAFSTLSKPHTVT